MTTLKLALPDSVVAIDNAIFLNLIDELADLAVRAGHADTGAALIQYAVGYRNEGECDRSVLSLRRSDVLGTTGVLGMLDIGLPSDVDHKRAETIVDEIWIGSVTTRVGDVA
ncbi:MAG: hypothetical protein JWM76_1406 [Pseudonocardiales bacterium]|nr:hypothetical protein [Pseudonocardiales bacterium]